MKCFNHTNIEAVAMCLGCGKALCPECCQSTDSGILVCSDACREKTENDGEIVRLIRQKTLTQNRVSGIFCIFVGVIFGFFGVYNLTGPRFFLPLAIFMIATCIGFIVGGIMYLRVAKARKAASNNRLHRIANKPGSR
jgi:hypothetical protein